MEKDKLDRMVGELILFFWMGLQPSEEIDVFISEYMDEANLIAKTLTEKYGSGARKR